MPNDMLPFLLIFRRRHSKIYPWDAFREKRVRLMTGVIHVVCRNSSGPVTRPLNTVTGAQQPYRIL